MHPNLFTRASLNLSLTPLERAALRFLEGLAASALIAGVVAVAPYLAGQSIDWQRVLSVFVTAALSAVLLALSKYAKAFADPPLPSPVPAPPVPTTGA